MNRYNVLLRSLFAAALLLLIDSPASAQPPIWETNFGPAIAGLTGEDDDEEPVMLSFAFPYDDVGFTTVYVGTNGCVQLGSLGTDDDIDYDHWRYFEEFIDDAAPEICPLNADWDLQEGGTVHFNDFGDRAVFTWNEVPSRATSEALASFQATLEATGRIVFGYNGILDGAYDLVDDMSTGLVVGITSSDGVDPGPTDLSGGPFPAGGTTYQAWCYDEADSCSYSEEVKPAGAKVRGARSLGGLPVPGPINTTFDLDQRNVIFGATGGGPSVLEVPTLDRLGIAALVLLLAGAASAVLRRNA